MLDETADNVPYITTGHSCEWLETCFYPGKLATRTQFSQPGGHINLYFANQQVL
jgi:hypothetical protein